MDSVFPIEGGCDCGDIRYRVMTEPLVVHCCHYRWCQRETGASYALNAMIEADRVINLGKEPDVVMTPSNSGIGQQIARCPRCRVAVWSHYGGTWHLTRFVRVGTLDEPGVLAPDVHIYTGSKQPWVTLDGNVPSYPGYYDRKVVWRQSSIDRLEALRPQIQAYKESLRNSQA